MLMHVGATAVLMKSTFLWVELSCSALINGDNYKQENKVTNVLKPL
jgi:BarA-like signal transduction histidine kinase